MKNSWMEGRLTNIYCHSWLSSACHPAQPSPKAPWFQPQQPFRCTVDWLCPWNLTADGSSRPGSLTWGAVGVPWLFVYMN